MANRYWVGGTGTWNTISTTNWSTTSGGPNGASVPTSADSVFFDQAGGYTVTMTGVLNCLDITVTNGSVTFSTGTSPSLNIYGSMSLSSTTWSSTGSISFLSSTTGKTINTGGTTLSCATLTFNGAGSWTLGANLTILTANTTVLTAGSLDLAGFTLTTGIFSSSNSNTRSIAFGTGFISLIFNSSGDTNVEMSTGTNFTCTGTGGFITDMSIARRFKIGQSGGMTIDNAPNLKISGNNAITIDSGSWIKTLEFYSGSTSSVNSTTLNLQNLILDGGSYTGITANMVAGGNISGNSKSIAALGIAHTGTTTITTALTVVGTTVLGLGTPTLVLSGVNLTTGTFSSSGTNTRAISFGANFIITTAGGGVAMADVTNFTYTGTGGFRIAGSVEQTISYGSTSGGSATNAINISFTAGSGSSSTVQTLTANSWFNKIDCTGFIGKVGTSSSATVRPVYVNNLILEPSGAQPAAYTLLQANMYGTTSTINGNGKQLYTFTVPTGGTVTLVSALAVTLYTHSADTLDLAGFTLTCASPIGSFTYTGGTLTFNGSTIQCITFVLNGPTLLLNNGTINCSTSFTLTSGSFTLAATGGTFGTTTLITHTAGTMTFLKSYSLTAGSTYSFVSGVLDVTGVTLSTGVFSSSNSNTRSIIFGTGFINLIYNSSGDTNVEMSNGTNFTCTGTGGFITDMSTARRFKIGQSGGMTMDNAPNLKISGGQVVTIDAGSWIKTLEFYSGSTSSVNTTTLNLQNLVLDGGSYTNITANIVAGGNISGNSKSIAALGIAHTGTTTITTALTVVGTTTLGLGTPTLVLSGVNLTTGTFSSSNTNTRAISFGANFIITTAGGGVAMADVTNFTYTGTGGFRIAGSVEQTITYGTTGGSATNAINISFTAGSGSSSTVQTLTANSWFNKIDCTGFIGKVGTSSSATVRPVYVNNLILEPSGSQPAAYTLLQANMYGTTSTINGNGKQLYTFTIPTGGTVTLVSALAVTLFALSADTLNMAGFTLTCASPIGSFTYTGGTLTMNGGTIQCITFVLNGPSFTLNNGTINCSTSFTLTSGSFTLAATGSTFGATPLITHTAGTMTFLKSYSLTVGSTYSFVSGVLDITNFTLATGKFESSNSNTRSIIFGTGFINLTFNSSGEINLEMSTGTNFTCTGTGGFIADMSTSRRFRIGQSGGMTMDNAPNLKISGGQVVTIDSGSWIKTLEFYSSSTSTVNTTTLNLQNLVLDGGSYTGITANMVRSGNISGNGKTIAALTINVAGAFTISGSLTILGTFTFASTLSTQLTLSADITAAGFTSSNSVVRSIAFGAFYINLTSSGLSMADATNFTYTGTGGFRNLTSTQQTITYGTTGGSATNAINAVATSSGGFVITAGSWFNILDFTGLSSTSGVAQSTSTGPYVNSLRLAATTGTYTSLSVTMYGNSTIAGSTRPLNTFYITSGATTTFTSAVAVSSYIHESNTTLNLATFAFTATTTITVNGGSMINFGTTSCTTFTVNGATLTVNSGSLNPTTSFVINSGVYTLGSSGSMGTTFTTFSHNAGNVIFQKSYTMSTSATYTFTSGSLDVSGITLGVGKFNSDNGNTRTLTFGTGFIRATFNSSGELVIGMANITNLTVVATTGGFLAPASNTKTVTIGTTGGGSSTNAPNVSLESGSSIVTLTSGSWFNKLDFGTTTSTIASTTLNANSVTLAGGTYTSLSINMVGTGILNGNSKTISILAINHAGTTTFASALTCTTLNQNSGTVNFATFNLTCTGTVTFTNGTYNNMGTLTCATFTIAGTFNLSSGTLTATTSFIVNSGAFTYSTGTLTARATFTHNGGTVTFSKAYALTATGTYTLSGGDLILNGVDLTTGIFSSSGAGIRSIQFGTNNIILAHTTAATTVLSMADVSNLTVTGTGGFTAAANITRTYTYGPSGASATNSANLTLTGNGTAIATISTGSWFNTLNFGVTVFVVPTTTVNINAITLSPGGTFTNLTVEMRGTGLITTGGKTIAGFVLNTTGTNTLAGNVTCTSYTQTAGLIDLAGYNIICSGAISITGGSMLNTGTITCTTFTVNGTFSLDSGTITPSVSVVLSSGTFNYNSGGTLSPVPTFTHTNGTFNLGKAYALTATGTYTLTAGTLNLNGFNLTTGIFNSSGTSTRSILFGANNIILAHTSVGQTVLGMADTTSFSNTGTGGFASAMTVARTFTVGTTVGAFNTSPNLSITSGVEPPTITNNSWFKILDFTGSSTTPTATTVNVDTLILSSGGTYTGLIPQFTRSQTWTAQFGKQLGGIGINALFNTLTLDNTQTYIPTSVCSVVAGTLNLGGADLTVGSFSSSGILTRSVIFGSNNIILSTPTAGVTVLSVADATNFNSSFVTGGFVATSAITRTFTFGTTGGSSLSAPNLTINSGSAIPTINTGSWFHILDFTGSSCTPAVSTVNVTSAILSSGGTFTNLSLTMRSNGSLTSNNKTISAFVVNHTDFGTTTIIGALLCATQTYTAGNVDFGNNNATSSAGAAYSSGAFSNINTITCTTFTITGTFLLTQGTITPSVSIILTSGSITYNGGIISPVPTFTHSAGTFILGKAYALTATGTYTLTGGSIVLNGYNLTTGIFSSSGTLARSISFSTGNIILATTTAATTNLLMNDATNFTQTATTGGFVSDASITRTFIFGTTGGTTTNAPNLAITSGSQVPTISTGSWFNTLDFTGSSTTPIAATLNISTLILSVGGTYTGLLPIFFRTQTWTAQFSKQLGGIGFNLVGGTLTLDNTQTYTATSQCILTAGTINLGGVDLTIGTFSSNNSNVRSLILGSNSITLATTTAAATNLDMATATNFTISGTGGFIAAASASRTFSFGSTAGGTATNSPNLTFTSGSSIQTITTASWFNKLDFGTTIYAVPSTILNLNSLTLSGSGTFSALSVTMVGSGTIISNGNTTLLNLTINGVGITTTLGSALTLTGGSTATGNVQLDAGTLALAGFLLTCNRFITVQTTARAISFGTGNIALAINIAGAVVISISDATNFTWTGTGGFTTIMSVTRQVNFGNTAGGSATNAINLSVTSGASGLALTSGGWFKNLNFTGSTCTPAGTINVDTLTLDTGGTYTGLLPVFTRTQTWTAQFSKQLNGIGVNGSGVTLTLSAGQTYTATSQCLLTFGTIDLGGSDLTIGTFNSSNSNVRSLVLGSNNIILSTTTAGATNLDMGTATNFTISGTGGFRAAADITRTYQFGNSGSSGTATNSPNLTLTGTGTVVATFSSNSYFNKLDFGTTAFTVTSITLNVNSLTLSSTGIYTSLSINTIGTGTIISNGRSLASMTVNCPGGTTTLGDAFTSATNATTSLTRGTLALAGFILTTGTFSSSNSNTRGIEFGTGNIVLVDPTASSTIISMDTVFNFSCSGTGGFVTGSTVSHTFRFGINAGDNPYLSGGTSANAPNLRFTGTGAAVQTIKMWCNHLDFGTTTFPFTASFTGIRCNSLTLSAGVAVTEYQGLLVEKVGTGTITTNGKNLGTLTNTAGTTTLVGNLELNPSASGFLDTTNAVLTEGTINLNGYTLTTNSFSSSNTNTRSIIFGTSNIIILGRGGGGGGVLMADITNFTWSGSTGGFLGSGTIGKTITIGSTAGGSISNAVNVSLPSNTSSNNTITTNSWLKNLNFTGSTESPSGQFYVDTLTLATGGTYTGILPIFTRTQTWTAQFSKQLGGIGFNLAGGTLTLDNTQTYTATSVCYLIQGTLNLGGVNQTFGSFSSSNTNTRAIAFGSNNIILATTSSGATNLDMGNTFNFTYTGTGGFTAAADRTRTFAFGTVGPPVGGDIYSTPGTYSWTAPAGVTSVSVVAVGGGGSGTLIAGTYSYGNGGGGGGLGWKNNISVTPGQSYTVVVGNISGDSYFINTSTVAGLGGVSGGVGGAYAGDGGGNGGAGGSESGGGGAAGYSGNGGNGGTISGSGTQTVQGGVGSGGGGAGGLAFQTTSGADEGTNGGGGVGIYGQGSSGAVSSQAGSDGVNGTARALISGVITGGYGGAYGGGGGVGVRGSSGASNNKAAGLGATGAVRIIWGPERSFPSTNLSAAYEAAAESAGSTITPANAINLTFTGVGTSTQTIVTGSTIKNLNFGTTGFTIPSGTIVNVDTLTLSSSGTYSNLTPVFTRTQTWTPQFAKQLGGIGVSAVGVTVTLEATQTYSNLAKFVVDDGTLNLNGVNLVGNEFLSRGTGARSIIGGGSITYYNSWSVTYGVGFTGTDYTINSFGLTFGGSGGSYGTLVQKNNSLTITGSNSFVDIQAVVNPLLFVDYLVVAGGGGGAGGESGGGGGGGGGAGGMILSNTQLVYGTTYSVTVGAGGAGGGAGNGIQGSPSVFGSYSAVGGGRGGCRTSGGNGGSGGGSGGGLGTIWPLGTGTLGQGNAGGANAGDNSGGGGGAGGVGGAAIAPQVSPGPGGIGLESSISGVATYYAGGGGGGGIAGPAAGGLGGGGNGAGSGTGGAGTANTGGGGGGGGQGSTTGGQGGSGVVIIRLSDSVPIGTTTGSPTITVANGYRVYKWTTIGSGSITFYPQ